MTKEFVEGQVVGIVRGRGRTPIAMKIKGITDGKMIGIFRGWNGEYKYTLRSRRVAINYAFPELEKYLFPKIKR